jgi:Uma2 family endonuclease
MEYPESDGLPMAETPLHGDEMTDLKVRFRTWLGARAYVGCNMLMYPVEGDPTVRFAPDVFVALGAPPGKRRVWKVWEEGHGPDLVIEVSSRGTWLEDAGNKKAFCAALGVREYVLYDPEREYLNPPLQVYRLEGAAYLPVWPAAGTRVASSLLPLDYELDAEGLLELYDRQSGDRLLRPDDVRVAREPAEARATQAEALATQAEARASEAQARAGEERRARLALEEELRRLRAEIEARRARGE